MYLTARINDQLGFNRPETYTGQLWSVGIMPQNSEQEQTVETGNQWIGLRENLQETMVFTIKYRSFL
jgi:hypothetical protein